MHLNRQEVVRMRDLITRESLDWDPFRELADIRDSFDKFFGRSLLSRKKREEDRIIAFLPAVEIEDEKDAILVKADLPGIEKKDVQVSVEDGQLILKGESKREEKNEDKEKGYYYSERSYGSFYRAVKLPAEVDQKNVKAKLTDGVLTIHLPKTEKAKEKKKVVEIE